MSIDYSRNLQLTIDIIKPAIYKLNIEDATKFKYFMIFSTLIEKYFQFIEFICPQILHEYDFKNCWFKNIIFYLKTYFYIS